MTDAQLPDLVVGLIRVRDARGRSVDEGAELAPYIAELTAIVHNQGNALAEAVAADDIDAADECRSELADAYGWTPSQRPRVSRAATTTGSTATGRNWPASMSTPGRSLRAHALVSAGALYPRRASDDWSRALTRTHGRYSDACWWVHGVASNRCRCQSGARRGYAADCSHTIRALAPSRTSSRRWEGTQPAVLSS